jgi:hypothetical protein
MEHRIIGTLEYWNSGMLEPLFSPLVQYSILPLFHYSSIPGGLQERNVLISLESPYPLFSWSLGIPLEEK